VCSPGKTFTDDGVLQFVGHVVGVQDDYLGTARLQVAHIMFCQFVVEKESFGQFAFDVLNLFSMDTKRQHPTRDLIDSSHALEDQAGSLVCVPDALRYHGSSLAERLLTPQQANA